jgi:hypothetical protein
MIRTKKINDVRVKPIKIPKLDKLKIKGYDMFSEIYSNIFICARKKSGKSTVVFNILKECSGKNTKVIIFGATIHKDPVYVQLIKHFEKKGNTVITYTSIKENGFDNLGDILGVLQEKEDSKSEEEEVQEDPILIFDDEPKEEKKKKTRKTKYLAPEIIFVFDDLSDELRDGSIGTLLKTNRHYKSKVIMSSQYVHDIQPQSLLQLDYMLLFGGHPDDKLKIIYSKLDLAVPYELFVEIYKFATKEKHNFLYIDKNNGEFRLNFNNKIDLEYLSRSLV